MKSKWYANWLIIITFCLLFSSIGIFIVSLEDSIGMKKCVNGSDLGENCICNNEGVVVCDEQNAQSIVSSEFVSTGLLFSYNFLNFVEGGDLEAMNVKFVDISQLGGGLKITLETNSLCNEDSISAPQIGFYKLEEDRLTLTIGTNVLDESFNKVCLTEGSFYIGNFNRELNDKFKIYYQDEFDSIYPANNCTYEGYIRNDGDVYNSSDGCFLCQCKSGKSSCEKENSCLK